MRSRLPHSSRGVLPPQRLPLARAPPRLLAPLGLLLLLDLLEGAKVSEPMLTRNSKPVLPGSVLSARVGVVHDTLTPQPVHTPECNGASKCLYELVGHRRGRGWGPGGGAGGDPAATMLEHDHARCSQRLGARTPSLSRRPST